MSRRDGGGGPPPPLITTSPLDLNIGGCVIPLDPFTGEPLLLQTWWHHDPWRVTVTSLLLVATRRSQVQPLLDTFYEEFPEPGSLRDGPHLRELVYPLGLATQRAERLRRFDTDYCDGFPVRYCYGVGEYVEAAYRLVHLKDEFCPTEDAVLMVYRAWLRSLPDDPLRWAR